MPITGRPSACDAEDRLADQVVDELLRRVLVHRDLLEHDLALGVEVVEERREDHVAHHVERGLDVMLRDAAVDDGVLARGGGVQLAAHLVEDLGDLERAVAARALEEQVLDEVRDAGLARRSRRGSRWRSSSPIVAERTCGSRSEITRSPVSSSVWTQVSMGGWYAWSALDRAHVEEQQGAQALRLITTVLAAREAQPDDRRGVGRTSGRRHEWRPHRRGDGGVGGGRAGRPRRVTARAGRPGRHVGRGEPTPAAHRPWEALQRKCLLRASMRPPLLLDRSVPMGARPEL